MLRTSFSKGRSSSSRASTSNNGASSSASQSLCNTTADAKVTSPPTDTISSIQFSPACSNDCLLMAASSWDCTVRVWEVTAQGASVLKGSKTQDGPVLDCCWSDDGSKIFTASCDKTVRVWDLNSGQQTILGQHENAVKTVNFIKSSNYQCLFTGSWDKTLKGWDPSGSTNPVLTLQLPNRALCAAMKYPVAVIGTANTGMTVFDLTSQPKEVKKLESPFKTQLRAIDILPDASGHPVGCVVGSVEGRVAVRYVNPTDPKDDFAFKCHRGPEVIDGFVDIYAINDVKVHPVHRTVATAGADGRFSFWNIASRVKISTSNKMDQAITACTFDASGSVLAYAVGYDWTKGHEHQDPSKQPQIYLHASFEDARPR